MCFSATASFTSSAVLAVAGALLVYKVKGSNTFFLALLPLLFAFQQFSEGVLWLYMPNKTDYLIPTIAKNIFLFMAKGFWSFWIAFALFIAEKELRRRKVMIVFLVIGIYNMLSALLVIPHIKPEAYLFSINYQAPQTSFVNHLISYSLYLIAIFAPVFISSLKNIKLLGVLSLCFLVVIYFIDKVFVVSLWCFFSALCSLSLFYILRKPPQEKPLKDISA